MSDKQDLGVEVMPVIDYYEDKVEKDKERKEIEKKVKKDKPLPKLTLKEQKVLDSFMVYADIPRAIREAGIETNQSPYTYFRRLKNKPQFKQALEERREAMKRDSIMSSLEVLEYLTAVVRGEVKDQFGLDAPLSERTRAALEIAKRTIDVEIKEKQKAEVDTQIVVKLDWKDE